LHFWEIRQGGPTDRCVEHDTGSHWSTFMTALAIELLDLKKSFLVRRARTGSFAGRLHDLVAPRTERVLAVDGISFGIRTGERVAFIGPNGAGKSTTLKLLSGILCADSGHARVLGLLPWRDRRALAYRVGTVFGQRSQLWYHLPARDTFALLARVYEVEPARFSRRFAELCAAFQLGPLLDKPVSKLSLGERMRAEIVASLLHEPELLLLDEPTIGLDATAKALVRDLLARMAERDGATLLLTSHDTGDIEEVCDRALVIHGGRLLWDGSIASLRRTYARSQTLTLVSSVENLCLSMPGVTIKQASPYRSELTLDLALTSVGAVVDAAQRRGQIQDLSIQNTALDDVIRALYAEAERKAAS
jgi:ABC-2 type transport system ATP-binding protein